MLISIVIGIITGLISGIIASFMFWYSLTHWLVPKLVLSPNIAKIKSPTSRNGQFYQFKVKNPSDGRPAIDLKFQASIHYPDFPVKGTTNVYPIPLDAVNLMELLPTQKGERRTRRIMFKINDPDFCDSHQRKIFPEHIKDNARDRSLKIEDLLSIAEDSFIKVYVAASDEFSGSRKVIRREYRLENVVEGKKFGI